MGTAVLTDLGSTTVREDNGQICHWRGHCQEYLLMPIEFVSGDLFANRFQAQTLTHGCNCQGLLHVGTGLCHFGEFSVSSSAMSMVFWPALTV